MRKSAIIIDLDFDNLLSYSNDVIINYLINTHKLRYNKPDTDICIKINNKFLKNNEVMYRLLSNIYDRVIESNIDINNIKKKYKYDNVIEYNHKNYEIDIDSIDTNYHFYQMKKELGPIVRNSFLFKEKDIDIEMSGGFNFDKKKIKYHNKESDPKLKLICDLYKVDCDLIKQNHIDYYHLLPNTQYRPFHLTTMFDNIKEFDYITPLKILSEYYDSGSYYDKLYHHVTPILKDSKRLNLFDSITPLERDSIMTQYVKCRKDCFILSIWKPAISGLNEFIDYLEKFGNIYYVKTISFSKKGLRNLLFWMYDDFTYTERIEFIEKKLNYIDTLDENNEVTFIIFDNIQNQKLSEQGAPFKIELRNKLLEFSKLDPKRYTGNDLLHINDYFYQTVEYSQIILNDNSLEMLNHQDCRKMIDNSYQIANLKIQTFRKMIYSNLSLLEIDRLLIIGEFILYVYGIKPFIDIDAIIIKNNNQDKSTRLFKFIENSKLFFCNIGIQELKNNKIVLKPKNFCYNQGFKFAITNQI
jgi:hypothetical protein